MQRNMGNPFRITKSTDLTDHQILDLWVDVAGEDALVDVARPASLMPMLILGGKGSGKTHLMRYFSFALQRLRFEKQGLTCLQGVGADRYIGVYLRCGGLNSDRFCGKGQSEDVWKDLFAYYCELWLAQELLDIANTVLSEKAELGDVEQDVARRVEQLFDKWPFPESTDISGVRHAIEHIQKGLDFKINNVSLTGDLDIDILVTRGKLVFGIPRILAAVLQPTIGQDVVTVYMLDEFENLTSAQQRFINTLVREKEVASTFKIGARLYGIKTYATYSDGEENQKDSEFELLPLDQKLRTSKNYPEFCRALIAKRLDQGGIYAPPMREDMATKLNAFFETVDDSWNSAYWRDVVSKHKPLERPHLKELRKNLQAGLKSGISVGIETEGGIDAVVEAVSVVDFPILEKANVLLLYQAWAGGGDLAASSKQIFDDANVFLSADSSSARTRVKQTLDHFRNDLAAQLLRDCDEKATYAGIDSFIEMSEGLPRALITILKNTYDWSVFNGESPFQRGRVSLASQRRGVAEASEWFFQSMRKAGRDGVIVQKTVERLAEICRVNRFADKPVECSLITFSIPESELSEEARHTLQVATSRSFLISIIGGQKAKNSKEVDPKYQLNKMLCPRWDLPIARRGTLPLSAEFANAIFEFNQENKFRDLLSSFRARMTAPTFGKKAERSGKSARGPDNLNLFGHHD